MELNIYGAYSGTVTTVTNPSKVQNLRMKENNSTYLTIEWDKTPRAVGYRLFKYNIESKKWVKFKDLTATSIKMSKSEIGANYNFKVKAYTIYNNTKYIGSASNEFKTREGIDVSAHNGKIDWKELKEKGIEFAVLRVGGRYYGKSSGTIYEDKYIKYNIEQATKYGIEFGVYFFSAAITEKEAIEEANWCIQKLKAYDTDKKCKYIAHDFEIFGQSRAEDITKEELNKDAVAFLSKVKASGYTPMLYGSKYYLTTHFNVEDICKKLGNCKIWLAHYTTNGALSNYKDNYDIWQYSDTGKLDGISGKVDLDIVYF